MQLVSGVVSTDSYTSTYNSYKPEIFLNCYGLIVPKSRGERQDRRKPYPSRIISVPL